MSCVCARFLDHGPLTSLKARTSDSSSSLSLQVADFYWDFRKWAKAPGPALPTLYFGTCKSWSSRQEFRERRAKRAPWSAREAISCQTLLEHPERAKPIRNAWSASPILDKHLELCEINKNKSFAAKVCSRTPITPLDENLSCFTMLQPIVNGFG